MQDATFGMTRTYIEVTDSEARLLSHTLRVAGIVHTFVHTDRRIDTEAQVDQDALDNVKHLCFVYTLSTQSMAAHELIDHTLRRAA